jgi:ribosomal protein L29
MAVSIHEVRKTMILYRIEKIDEDIESLHRDYFDLKMMKAVPFIKQLETLRKHRQKFVNYLMNSVMPFIPPSPHESAPVNMTLEAKLIYLTEVKL